MTNHKLVRDYHYVAKHIAIKNSLYIKDKKPTWFETILYYVNLFFVVVILAGILTGFGQAAPIISAIISLFPFVNITVGYFALLTFSLYAIPWALIYIPDISNLYRNWWENTFNTSPNYNQNSIALERAHNVLAMLYRKEMKHNKKSYLTKIDALQHVSDSLIHLAILDTAEHFFQESQFVDHATFYNNITQRDSFRLGYHIKSKIKSSKNPDLSFNEEKIFTDLLLETADLHLSDHVKLNSKYLNFLKKNFEDQNNSNHYFWKHAKKFLLLGELNIENIKAFRHELLQIQTGNNSQKATKFKQLTQKLWQIQCKIDNETSFWSQITEKTGTILGFLNASIANASGTALAPLYIISTILMIYSIPNAVIPFYLSLSLVSAFAISGFVSSFGITRKSIEKAFVNMSNALLDKDRANRPHKQFSYTGPFYIKPFKFLFYLNKRYSVLPILMALFLSLAIASFNFLAGVTFAHIILNPGMMVNPTQVATFSIQSLSSLHAFELAFGIIGFGFTVIAVAPLMLCAWKNFTKAIKLEPISTKPLLTSIAALASLINTALMFRMMLRPGSPLDLFFGATPWIIQTMTYVAPICILVLGFALFYMGLQTMLNDRGRNMIEIYNESLAIKADYIKPQNPGLGKSCSLDDSKTSDSSLIPNLY